MKTMIATFSLLLVIASSVSAKDKVEIPWVPSIKDIMLDMGQFTEEELNPDSIKILVWNMYKGENPTWAEDYEKLTEGQDILMNQEMYLNDLMKDMFSKHEGYGYHTATSFIYLPSKTRTGVTTASRVRTTKYKPQRSRALEPAIKTPKMALETFYKIQGTDKELMAVNIHAINFVSTQALGSQLRDLAKDIKDYKGPVVFAGDFNTWSPGKLRLMRRIIVKGLKMKEVAFKEDHRKKVFNNIIDYVFVRDLEVIDSKSYGDILGSDHTPMTVELKFKI
jgi:endonuclease/exonuclease/phosphatase (EEP) superfamily protein YafD